MNHKITIIPSGVEFQASDGGSILESALMQGVPIDYSCKNGDCGSCQASLKAGKVKLECGEIISSGAFLTCSSVPVSDIEMEADYYPELTEIKRKTMPAKVSRVENLTADVLSIILRTPPASKMKYLPGQYIDLSYRGVVRPYSIANTCDASGEIELHIKKVQEGKMSSLLFDDLKESALMRINGPNGTFFIRESHAPLAFLVTGTGFAPAKAMIERLIEKNSLRPIHLFWGARQSSSFYSNLPDKWNNGIANFKYIPVLSKPQSDWAGAIGYVQQAFLNEVSNISDFHIYACGSQKMIESSKVLLVKSGLNKNNFYSDAFTAAKEK